jgi:hypothetical protein
MKAPQQTKQSTVRRLKVHMEGSQDIVVMTAVVVLDAQGEISRQSQSLPDRPTEVFGFFAQRVA